SVRMWNETHSPGRIRPGSFAGFQTTPDAAAIPIPEGRNPPAVSVLTRTRIHCLAYHERKPRCLSGRISLLDLHRPNATVPEDARFLLCAAPNDAGTAGEFSSTVSRRVGQDQVCGT